MKSKLAGIVIGAVIFLVGIFGAFLVSDSASSKTCHPYWKCSTTSTTTPTTSTTTPSTTTTTVTSTTTTTVPTTTTVTTTPSTTAEFGLSIPGQRLTGLSDADRQTLLSDVVAVGAKWLRFDLNWRTVEYTKGTYAWGTFDTVAQEARAHGLNVLLIVDTTPPWACKAGWATTCNWDSPPDPAAWANFAQVAAAHYSAMGIHDFEVWNEPNLTNAWAGTRDDYINIVKSGYAAFHAGDPQAQVLVGGFGFGSPYDNGTPSEWLQSIYSAGAGSDFDIASTHPYPGGSDSNGTNTNNGWYQMKLLRDVMVNNGDSAKKVWGSEYGYGLNGETESQIQSKMITDTANWKSYSWSGVLMWYLDVDFDGGGYGLSNGGFPIVHRPRWTTWQTYAR